MGFQVAPATEQEWAEVVEWAAEEQWNPGLADRAHFWAQDPNGFFLGRLDGRPVSAVSVVIYDEAYAFLGYYLVRPEVRGQGFGVATWRAGLEHAGKRTIGLDGVVAQQENYRTYGFSFAYRTVRYTGLPTACPERNTGDTTRAIGGTTQALRATGTATPSSELIEIEEDLELVRAVAAYDARCYPADRPEFVARWITAPYHTALAVVRDGQVHGYGVIRPARDGSRIGPLFADTPEDAAALFDALAASASVAGGAVALDVPEPNQAAVSLAKSRGLEPAFETARMYTGPIRDVNEPKIFGVTSLELG